MGYILASDGNFEEGTELDINEPISKETIFRLSSQLDSLIETSNKTVDSPGGQVKVQAILNDILKIMQSMGTSYSSPSKNQI